ncbi:hypothetical protein ElyMa_002145700 [Elysia marginata]|uniref:Uncharacterized protein n=1 Tax=Elysia marginata TaxID=1093978 RepID=A0AAV4FN92_9GAST|nr:hypothetical protein ElyMa_002145700 [Elysia marginata]
MDGISHNPKLRLYPIKTSVSQRESVTKESKKISMKKITTVTTARYLGRKVINKNYKTVISTDKSCNVVVLQRKLPEIPTMEETENSHGDLSKLTTFCVPLANLRVEAEDKVVSKNCQPVTLDKHGCTPETSIAVSQVDSKCKNRALEEEGTYSDIKTPDKTCVGYSSNGNIRLLTGGRNEESDESVKTIPEGYEDLTRNGKLGNLLQNKSSYVSGNIQYQETIEEKTTPIQFKYILHNPHVHTSDQASLTNANDKISKSQKDKYDLQLHRSKVAKDDHLNSDSGLRYEGFHTDLSRPKSHASFVSSPIKINTSLESSVAKEVQTKECTKMDQAKPSRHVRQETTVPVRPATPEVTTNVKPDARESSGSTRESYCGLSFLDCRSIWPIGRLLGQQEKKKTKKIFCYKDYLTA